MQADYVGKYKGIDITEEDREKIIQLMLKKEANVELERRLILSQTKLKDLGLFSDSDRALFSSYWKQLMSEEFEGLPPTLLLSSTNELSSVSANVVNTGESGACNDLMRMMMNNHFRRRE